MRTLRTILTILTLLIIAIGGSAHAQASPPSDLPPVALKTPGFKADWLAPVDGVSVQTYAHIVFEMFATDALDNDKLLASHGLTQARFDKIGEVMVARMREDTSFKFIDIYGAYYIENAPGPFAAYAKDVAQSVLSGGPLRESAPMSEENYRRVQGFYARKAPFARDTSRAAYDEILADQGMNFIDYQVLGPGSAVGSPRGKNDAQDHAGLSGRRFRGVPGIIVCRAAKTLHRSRGQWRSGPVWLLVV